MKYLFTVSFLLTFHLCTAQVPTFSSATFYEGNNSNYIQDVATDVQGNIYSTGYFYGQVILGSSTYPTAGGSDAFVMKTDSVGSVIWSIHLTGPDDVRAYTIERDGAGNFLVGGYFSGSMTVNGTTYFSVGRYDAFIFKLTPSGSMTWIKQMNGPKVQPSYFSIAVQDIKVDASENIYFTGFFTDSIYCDGQNMKALGVNDILVGKLDKNGTLAWMKKAGGTYSGNCGLPNNDNGAGLCLDSFGNVYITGHYAFNATFGGSTTVTSVHDVDIYLAKYDNNGNFLWVKSSGGLSWEMATSVECDQSNNVYMTGHFQLTCIFGTDTLTSPSPSGSPYDIFLVKYDPSGNIIWVKQEGGSKSEYSNRVMTDGANNVYIAGLYWDNASIGDSTSLQCWSASDSRCYVAKYDASGIFKYLAHGGGYSNFPYGLCLTPNNNIVLGGNSYAAASVPITFGSFSKPTTGKQYLWLTTIYGPFKLTGKENPVTQERAVLYPNPMHTSATLRFENPTRDEYQFTLYDISGKICQMKEHIRNEEVFIERNDLPSGVYFYSLMKGKVVMHSGKVVIE